MKKKIKIILKNAHEISRVINRLIIHKKKKQQACFFKLNYHTMTFMKFSLFDHERDGPINLNPHFRTHRIIPLHVAPPPPRTAGTRKNLRYIVYVRVQLPFIIIINVTRVHMFSISVSNIHNPEVRKYLHI